mgnify:CR=1 FL=1
MGEAFVGPLVAWLPISTTQTELIAFFVTHCYLPRTTNLLRPRHSLGVVVYWVLVRVNGDQEPGALAVWVNFLVSSNKGAHIHRTDCFGNYIKGKIFKLSKPHAPLTNVIAFPGC